MRCPRGLLGGLLAMAAIAGAQETGPVFFGGIRTLREGECLDLDNGGLFPSVHPYPGGVCEVRGPVFLVGTVEDAAFAEATPRWHGRPWHRVTTSRGRTAWVQVLDAGVPTTLRFLTRVGGSGARVLPAVQDPFCIGSQDGIDIHFTPSSRFVRYRIERGSALTGEYTVLDTVAKPPFRDTMARKGRHAYRITGLSAEGEPGLPVAVEGTRRSRGVATGIAELRRGDRFDFLLGAKSNEGDLEFVGTYGGRSGASFRDAFGRWALPASDPEETNPWLHVRKGGSQIAPGSTFLVPLRGGGVARCRLEFPPPTERDFEARLHYAVCGDGPDLPAPVSLRARRFEGGVRVDVKVAAPYRLERLEVRERLADRGPFRLDVRDGVAVDAQTAEGQVREYTAVAVDPAGRRALPGRVRVTLLGTARVAGVFQFHYKQGYSLELQRVVPPADADVVFATCAGGISSIRLEAPGGIVNLARALPRELADLPAEQLFERVEGANPKAIRLGPGADGDRRVGASDVFVVRTRHGGWAKLAITHRGREGGWTKKLATVRYVYSPDAPKFVEKGGKPEELSGFLLGRMAELTERIAVLRRWRADFARLWADPLLRALATDGPQTPLGGGELPDPGRHQEVLLGRAAHGSYEKCTFSFRFGIRDDPDREKTRNDWDLQYGNGGDSLQVCMVSDDRSTITDLGRLEWKDLLGHGVLERGSDVKATAEWRHVYLVHTLDQDADYHTLFRITALAPGDKVAFEWISLQPDGVKMSPGFAPDAAVEAHIRRLLQNVKAADTSGPATGPAAETRARLKGMTFAIGLEDARAKGVLDDLGKVTGIRFVLERNVDRGMVLLGGRMTPAQLLTKLCAWTGLRWRIEKDGSVHLR